MPTIAAMQKPSISAYSNTAHTHWNLAETPAPRAATASTIRSKAEPTAATAYWLLAAESLKKLRK